jgi:hypothetical protein
MVTIEEDGVARRVTAVEAFLLYITKRGLDGDSTAARAAIALLEEARPDRTANRHGDTRACPQLVDSQASDCVIHGRSA